MVWSRKSGARRAEIRKHRPDTAVKLLRELQADGGLVSLWVAAVFCAVAIGIFAMGPQVARYRPGERTQHDIVSRVDFVYSDPYKFNEEKRRAREETPRVYHAAAVDPWTMVEQKLLALPDVLANVKLQEITDEAVRKTFDEPTLAIMQDARSISERPHYERSVHDYIQALRNLDLIVLADKDRNEDLNRSIIVPGAGSIPVNNVTYSLGRRDELASKFTTAADANFKLALDPKIVALTTAWLTPTHELDDAATTEARNRAEERVPVTSGNVYYKANMAICKNRPD